jgi:sulfate/thiosulfate transport system permease protein
MATTIAWSTKVRVRAGVLPGFGLSFGITVTYLSLIVLIPLSALFLSAANIGWSGLWKELSQPAVGWAFAVTFGVSLCAALVNSLFGVLSAWVLVRYRFPGRRLLDALVDLPFALPTAVAGISISALFAKNGWLGSWLVPHGITVNYTHFGIGLALTFIGLPFVVRTVQPVMEELSRDTEEAAACLGASRWAIIRRVIFPELLPAVLTGFALSFARAIGEYGSIVFVSNMSEKLHTQIVPHLIFIRLEENNYVAATAIGAIMLVASFGILFLVNVLQRWAERRSGSVA